MNALINLGLIILVLVGFVLIVRKVLKKNKESIEEEDIAGDDKLFTIEALVAFVKQRLDEITKVNLYDIGLSEEELERRRNKKYSLKKALKGCTYR